MLVCNGFLTSISAVDQTEEERCGTAIQDYDSLGAERAIEEATRLFSAKDKADVAARISSSQRGGPWLLAWAPGAKKGSTEDDVLVLAFDLSHIRTQEQAEQAFQGWRNAIEFNPDLWRNNTIANEAWYAAIIRWANDIGEDLAFYKRMSD